MMVTTQSLFGAMCAIATIALLLMSFVITSVFFPVEEWLVNTHETLLLTDESQLLKILLNDQLELDGYNTSMMSDEEDDECLVILNDPKHGDICVVSS